MSARNRAAKRGEATRRLQGAARRLDGTYLIAPESGTPHAVFNLGPQRELLVIYLGRSQRYRAWVRPTGDPDRSRQVLFGDVTTEAALAELLTIGRGQYA